MLSLVMALATCAGILTSVFSANAEETVGRYGYFYGNAYGKYYKMHQEGNKWAYSKQDEFALAEPGGDNVDNLHPGNTGDVMRGWLAPADGNATVSGSVALKSAPTGSNPDVNGIRFSLVIKRRNVEAFNDAEALDERYGDYEVKTDQPVTFSIRNVDIKKGDVILISVNNNGNNNSDSNTTQFMVSFTKMADGDENVPDNDFGDAQTPLASFFGKQGVDGWFYAYGQYDKYILMNWGRSPIGYSWIGNEYYQFIGETTVHPQGRWNNLKIWVASFDGEIEIDGSIERNATEGDGTFVNVYHNDTRIWWEECDIIGSRVYPIEAMTLSVKKGDTIVFEVSTGPKYCDRGDGIELITNIYRKRIDTNVANDSELDQYLAIVDNEAAMVGVKQVAGGDTSGGCGAGVYTVTSSVSVSISLLLLLGIAALLKRNKKGGAK